MIESDLLTQIEPRYVNLTETCFVAPPEKIAAACDKNTIGVVGILGTTYSGHYEDLAGIDEAISESPSVASQHREALFAKVERVAGSFVCSVAAVHASHPG